MPEMRRDPITKRWVIIATERAQRPELFPGKNEAKEEIGQEHNPNCFFCEGNEDATPGEVLVYRESGTKPNEKGWKLRVVPNKYAALNLDNEFQLDPGHMLQMKSYARGVAEVIIESPHHSKNPALFSQDQMSLLFRSYRDRYQALCEIEGIKYIIIFRNNGQLAGASIEHPHSQIMATSVIPLMVVDEIAGAKDYYESVGKCVFCDMVEKELTERTRLVYENKDFVAFEPYASKTPFETWIVPKEHQPRFELISDEKLDSLAEIQKAVLYKLYKGLDNPPYNYYLHTSPIKRPIDNYYHWHIEILPKTTMQAGFELGTGMYINISIPEECAKFLRSVELNN